MFRSRVDDAPRFFVFVWLSHLKYNVLSLIPIPLKKMLNYCVVVKKSINPKHWLLDLLHIMLVTRALILKDFVLTKTEYGMYKCPHENDKNTDIVGRVYAKVILSNVAPPDLKNPSPSSVNCDQKEWK